MTGQLLLEVRIGWLHGRICDRIVRRMQLRLTPWERITQIMLLHHLHLGLLQCSMVDRRFSVRSGEW